MKGDALDPKGLIADAYAIEGITLEECRTIFLDWALSLSGGPDVQDVIRLLLDRHGVEGHPMTEVLQGGLQTPQRQGRRGGRAARHPEA